MERSKQNLTLTIDENVLLAARRLALDRGTSVNQLVREYLTALISEDARTRKARTALKRLFEKGLVEVGEKRWTREELHER